jgi:hypothetical protein
MTHPCTDHTCDHCYLCDVVGVCCGSVSVAQRARLEAEHRKPYTGLAVTIAHEAGSIRSLGELVRADAARQGRGLLANSSQPELPAAPTAATTPNPSRKEAIRVSIPRTNR